MNAPHSFNSLAPSAPHVAAPPAEEDKEEVKLAEYLVVLVDNKFLIGCITMLAILLSAAYAMLAKPVYESNLLIQVEDSKGAASNILGEASSLFDVKTPAAGEIEIIRSRMVIGQAVENTRLFIDAQPRYLPVLGSWLARRSDGLSTPGLTGVFERVPFLGEWLAERGGWTEPEFFRTAGYVSGSEAIEVPHLEMSPGLREDPFILTRGEGNGYRVQHDALMAPVDGQVGTMLDYQGREGSFQLMVARIDGKTGAQFTVTRSSRLAAVESLQERLQLAEKGRQSGVINVILQDGNARRLTLVLNEIGRQYVRQNVDRKAAEAQKTLAFLGEQLPQYKKEQEEAEKVYNRYRNQKGTVAFDEEARLVLGQTVELQTKLLEAKQRRKELEARFTGNHPSLQTLDAQIAAWNREINTLNARVKQMPQIQQDALRMERDVRVNTEMYQSLLNSSLQLSLVKEGKIGNVRLLDEAALPEIPVRPKKPLIVALGAVAGLLLGVAAAMLRNAFLRGIQSSHEIEMRTGLNVYSTIPMSSDQNTILQGIASRRPGIHLLAVSNPADPAIESLRSLRTALQFAMLEAPNNRVVITGPTPGVGKTFVSVNFAAIMAAGGKRVLLIDSDLRKGLVHKPLGLDREHGLSELIAGTLTASEAIRAQVIPGLDVITTGVLPPNPAEMMMSESFAQVLESLSSDYDLVIIDTPPVLVAADTAAIAPHVGTVLLVARAVTTHIAELQECAKRLAHSGKAVNGVLFNAVDISRRKYGSYGYKYGGYRYTHYSYAAGKQDG